MKDNPEYIAKQRLRDKNRVYNPDKSRWQTIYKKYKLTKPMYEALLAEQNGVCAICSIPPKNYYLSVDHDHSCCSGVKSCGECVRGLLCAGCNAMLGRLNDDASNLIAYLETYARK